MKIPIAGKKVNLAVVAMADIAFLLLIFLMVTSIVDQSQKLQINTPIVSLVEPIPQEQIFKVHIDRNAIVYFKGNTIKLRKLAFEYKRHLSLFPDPVIMIVGDESVPYEKVDDVVQILRKNTAIRIGFVCKEKKGE